MTLPIFTVVPAGTLIVRMPAASALSSTLTLSVSNSHSSSSLATWSPSCLFQLAITAS